MGQTVLITGASGFLAIWVVREFLSHGYAVVGAVRSSGKADQIRKDLDKYSDKLRFVTVPDIRAPGAFDEAVKGVDGVIHTASPYQVAKVKDVEHELLKPAILGTTGILESIKRNNPGVKRVVITSSYAAVATPGKPKDSGVYTEEDWNQFTYESAKNSPPFLAYVGSKAFAERAAWDFVAQEKPNFQLATICPPAIHGPVVQPLDSWSNLNLTSEDIHRLIDGSVEEVPTTIVPLWIDVRDVAVAHRLAYEKEAAAGQRYLTSAGNYSFAEVADIIRRRFPELNEKIPSTPKASRTIDKMSIDSSKAKKELGITFRPLEDCVVDTVDSLMSLQKKFDNART